MVLVLVMVLRGGDGDLRGGEGDLRGGDVEKELINSFKIQGSPSRVMANNIKHKGR